MRADLEKLLDLQAKDAVVSQTDERLAALAQAPVPALPPVRANRVRALGVTSLKRTSLAPDIPTIDESGLRGFELRQMYSLVAPAGTPTRVVQRLNREMVQRLPSDDVKQRFSPEGVEVVVSTPAFIVWRR